VATDPGAVNAARSRARATVLMIFLFSRSLSSND